jgi:hypothetical protein
VIVPLIKECNQQPSCHLFDDEDSEGLLVPREALGGGVLDGPDKKKQESINISIGPKTMLIPPSPFKNGIFPLPRYANIANSRTFFASMFTPFVYISPFYIQIFLQLSCQIFCQIFFSSFLLYFFTKKYRLIFSA